MAEQNPYGVGHPDEARLTFRDLIDANLSRVQRWHPGGLAEWSPLEWAGAMAGEAGEACNAAKKLKRIDGALANINHEPGRSLTDRQAACRQIAKEVADTIIYGALLVAAVGEDLPAVLTEVFNTKSQEYGFPERLPVPPPGAVQAICNDCCTFTWCSRLGLCLSEAHADEHPEIQRVPPPGAVPVAPQAERELAQIKKAAKSLRLDDLLDMMSGRRSESDLVRALRLFELVAALQIEIKQLKAAAAVPAAQDARPKPEVLEGRIRLLLDEWGDQIEELQQLTRDSDTPPSTLLDARRFAELDTLAEVVDDLTALLSASHPSRQEPPKEPTE